MAQREWAQTGLIGPMQGAIPTQSHNLSRGWPHHWGLRPLIFFEQWRVFFYVPHELISARKCCETGPAVFRPHPRKLESLTVRRCHYKGSTFVSFI